MRMPLVHVDRLPAAIATLVIVVIAGITELVALQGWRARERLTRKVPPRIG